MSSDELLIVGLGASAGGIKAFKEFFEHVPADSGIAYVVILHLSPDHDSRLAEVLQVSASIPVTQVRERVRVERNHVYVVPPNQSLSMVDGHLGVSNMTRHRRATCAGRHLFPQAGRSAALPCRLRRLVGNGRERIDGAEEGEGARRRLLRSGSG